MWKRILYSSSNASAQDHVERAQLINIQQHIRKITKGKENRANKMTGGPRMT